MTAQPDFTFRRPTLDDVQAVVDLCNAGDIAATGKPQTDAAEILDGWNASYLDLNRDVWLAETPEGRVAGYVECFHEPGDDQIMLFYYLYADFVDTGLEATLLALGEEHARELASSLPAEQPLTLMTAFYANENRSRRLVEAEGYTAVRHFYRMEIAFDAPPPTTPEVPGVTLRPYVPEQDEFAVYEALEDAFEDHWLHRRVTLDEWRTEKIRSERYDPALWLVAEVDGVVAGGAIGSYNTGVAWVRMLGVRREYRQRGIARAILLAVFNLFYARGDRRLGLGVDASSPTGATRLYESAGMRVTDQRVVYTKLLPR